MATGKIRNMCPTVTMLQVMGSGRPAGSGNEELMHCVVQWIKGQSLNPCQLVLCLVQHSNQAPQTDEPVRAEISSIADTLSMSASAASRKEFEEVSGEAWRAVMPGVELVRFPLVGIGCWCSSWRRVCFGMKM